MFEHVGAPLVRTYPESCMNLPNDAGVMLRHTIGNADESATTNPFIAKYIFPGGYIPSLSEISMEAKLLGLIITDAEALRLHHAYTLQEWRKRFLTSRDEAVEMYDERFFQIWKLYLSTSETAFRYEGIEVFQIQLTKRQNAVPITRDYIALRENQLKIQDSNPSEF